MTMDLDSALVHEETPDGERLHCYTYSEDGFIAFDVTAAEARLLWHRLGEALGAADAQEKAHLDSEKAHTCASCQAEQEG